MASLSSLTRCALSTALSRMAACMLSKSSCPTSHIRIWAAVFPHPLVVAVRTDGEEDGHGVTLGVDRHAGHRALDLRRSQRVLRRAQRPSVREHKLVLNVHDASSASG